MFRFGFGLDWFGCWGFILLMLSLWLEWQQHPIFNFAHPYHSFVTPGLSVGSLFPKERFCYVLCWEMVTSPPLSASLVLPLHRWQKSKVFRITVAAAINVTEGRCR